MAAWRRLTGAAGIVVGAAAAGTGALLAAQRIAVGRIRQRAEPAAGEPLGQLRGRPVTVLADDGVPLHTEISGPDDAPVTVIFSHGYTLNQDVWHYQRAQLADSARLVFWDQRGHGRSGRSDPAHVSIGQLGADLHAVLAVTAPGPGPVVLAGHSMGGMTIMAMARQHPGLFGTKIAGVALISTAASGVDPAAWLPAPVRPIVRIAAPSLLREAAGGHGRALVQLTRELGGDVAFLATRQMAFGDPQISPAVVDYLERIIRATPFDVVAQFYLALLDHDECAALGLLGRVPVMVLVGEADRMISSQLSTSLAAAIPGAELIRVPGAGHAVILERPDIVNKTICSLIVRASAAGDAHGRSA
ncbi:MAG TPA: alpha/beta hydrolase [Streptosporangiaceae bacterium]|nr:alpha/beta hydrolase [Streptosporangiaceae bacterium]